MSSKNIITVDPALFIKLVAEQTNTNPEDYFKAIQAANLGILVAEQRKITVGAGEKIFPDDIVPNLPNSIFKVYVQVSGLPAILDVEYVFGTNRIPGKALDGAALAISVPKEFNHPVGRDGKINYFPETATTIDIIRVIEFRIGQ